MATHTWTNGARETITAAGKRLEAACFGPSPADAPTIVMLHDGMGSVARWEEFPQRIAATTGFGVFVYSRAGYGWSDPVDLPRPLDYLTREALESLPSILDAIGFTRGILLGHGDGAAIVSIYLGNVEDFRVRGLVLLAPRFFAEPSRIAAIAAARRDFAAGELREELAKYHRDVDHAFTGWSDVWIDPGMQNWDIGDTIDYWRVPVLAVQGDADTYGTEANIREIETRIYSPLDVEMLNGCGPSPHREQPGETLAVVGDFAARLERIERTTVEVG